MSARLTVDMEVQGRKPLACDACGATFLGGGGEVCSACGAGMLEAAEVHALGEPERHVPDGLGRTGVEKALVSSVSAVRYRTAQLAVPTLMERAQLSWWPLWMVDGELLGTWRGRAGTDYEVQSSREVLQGGVWVTKPHIDTRIDWVDRVGQVRTSYDNVIVTALRAHDRWAERLGGLDGARAVEGEVGQGVIRLPDRHPREARPGAEAAFHRLAARQAHEALGSDHLADVVIDGSLRQEEWTWLLVPVWTTWYDDDAGERRALWVSGVTGRVWGPRMASQRKGLYWAALWVVLGLGCLAGSVVVGLVGIVLWPLLLLAAVGGLLGLLLMVLALVPVLTAWRHNRTQAAMTP